MATTKKKRTTRRPAATDANCSSAFLDVGRAIKSNRVFITFPDTHYDRTITLGHVEKHLGLIDDNDLEWLVTALAKEMGADRCAAIAEKLSTLFYSCCKGTGDCGEGSECSNCDGLGFQEGNPKTADTSHRQLTDEEVEQWGAKYALTDSLGQLRTMIEDARTL